MARARNIKPGFFKNEVLAELAFEYRLLFAGLWTLADREGRLEDRPKKIRMEIFPADNVDCEAGLEALANSGLITRYVVEGCGYIWINEFLEHQKPHVKEAPSAIPPYLGSGEPQPRLVPAPDKEPPEQEPAPAPEIASRADSLIASCLNPESLKKRFPGDNHVEDPPTPSAAPPEDLKPNPVSLAEGRIDSADGSLAAMLSAVCIANGIRVNPFHPLVRDWARDNVTMERLKDAIATAKQRKGSDPIPAAYLDRILCDTSKPVDNSWKRDDAKAAAMCRELDIPGPKRGEEMQAFHTRVESAIRDRARRQVA